MVILLSAFCFILTVALVASVVVNLRYGNMLINIEDNIDTCLEVLDKRYHKLMHVFDDSPGIISTDPLVKKFLDEVEGSRNDILVIANIISKPTELVEANIGDEEESVAQNLKADDASTSGKVAIRSATREKDSKEASYTG